MYLDIRFLGEHHWHTIWYAYFASYRARLSSFCILHSVDLRGLLLCLTKVCSLWNTSVVSLHLALVLTASNESFPEDISTAIVIDLCDVPACCVLVLHCTVWHIITLEWHSLWHKGLLLPSVQHFRFATQKDIRCFKSQHKIFCLTLSRSQHDRWLADRVTGFLVDGVYDRTGDLGFVSGAICLPGPTCCDAAPFHIKSHLLDAEFFFIGSSDFTQRSALFSLQCIFVRQCTS